MKFQVWYSISLVPISSNPRTPCGVRRARRQVPLSSASIFQSTHPVRGATVNDLRSTPASSYFNPRTPCGVRLYRRAERFGYESFQSTHPVRGATYSPENYNVSQIISIHAPRAGCDNFCPDSFSASANFNPRTPCGVRRLHPAVLHQSPGYFNPRTPCGVRRVRLAQKQRALV